jgi:hypothetical protein
MNNEVLDLEGMNPRPISLALSLEYQALYACFNPYIAFFSLQT